MLDFDGLGEVTGTAERMATGKHFKRDTLADGVDFSYTCDVAVLPSHQGIGLGKEIVAKLAGRSSGHNKIILYAVPGKEPFYRKLQTHEYRHGHL